jgi:tetratricopeptide (TPR) repeat protein
VSLTQLPVAKTNSFSKLVKQAKNACSAAIRNSSKIGKRLTGRESKKEFFTSDDYQSWISTRVAEVKSALRLNKNPSLKNSLSIELSALERQQDNPVEAYEARKSTLVEYADSIRKLGNENFLTDIAPIWHALAMNDTKPAELFLHSLLDKSGPTAGKSAFLIGQIREGRFDYGHALKFYRKAYFCGPKNRNYLEANAHLAFLLENYDEAEGLLKREIELLKVSRRKFPGKIYNAIKNLAQIYEIQGDLEAALAQHQEALEVRESVLGSDHPEIAAALNNMAALCEVHGHLDEAHTYIIRALKIYQAVFGLENPKVAASLSNLAAIYQKKNQFEEAEKTYKRGLEMALKLFGKNSPLYVKIKLNLERLQAQI